MSVEWFFKLKEFDSLSKERINHLKAMKDQEDRLSALNVRRQDALTELESLKQDLMTSQQNLFETEKKLKNAETQASLLGERGGDELKIAEYKKEALKFEEDAFEWLAKIDEVNQEMLDKKSFLNGIEKTMHEIAGEVKAESDALSLAINNLDLRLKLIQEELPTDFRQTLQKIIAKKLAIGPFTRIENGSCYFCRYKISRMEESEIDMLKQLKLCPQCNRIFLPYGS